MKKLIWLLLILSACPLFAQAPFGLLPQPKACFFTSTGAPNSGGKVFSYAAGTTTPLATYADNSGLIQNTNPVLLDSTGCSSIWLAAASYKITLKTSADVQLWTVDNVSNLGAVLHNQAVLLDPGSNLLQTILGPVGADYFTQNTPHFTSPGVRVSLFDPASTWDTAVNPFTVTAIDPAASGQNVTFPDPKTAQSNIVINPNYDAANPNSLDCSAAGITCKRKSTIWMEGAACNNTTAALGWDTFGTNSPTPICVPGSSIQKGVMALPGAATLIQQNTGANTAAGTVTTTYLNATTTGNLLLAWVAVDGTKTVSGCTDTTNAYTRAVAVTNGNYTWELWYFNGSSTTKNANAVLTCTLSGAANSSMYFAEYAGILAGSMLDKTASATGTGTAVTTGTTVGTSQASELVITGLIASGFRAVTAQDGHVQGPLATVTTLLTGNSQAVLQQTTSTQNGTFTLDQSSTWAAAVATFKTLASTTSTVTAQRQVMLPSTFLPTFPVNADIKWMNPQQATGTVKAQLGASVICSADGNTDDPTYNAPSQGDATVSASGVNLLTTTSLAGVNVTGCAGGNIMHGEIRRFRYDVNDTYPGWIYVLGVNWSFGISQ